jgi:hypothetical protein
MPTGITIAPCLPTDIAGGAPNAPLDKAAIFAWQEFIALNWPAVTQTGAANTRGVPDGGARLDSVNGPAGTMPTWTTYRHKIEIFPGGGNPPSGITPGGYDDVPRYIYNPNPPDAQPPMAPGVGGDGRARVRTAGRCTRRRP